MCSVCEGRGEVSASITTGVVEYGPVYDGYDWRGNIVKTRAAFPTRVEVNPHAWDKKIKSIWILDYNKFYPPWSTSVCISCHGTGSTK